MSGVGARVALARRAASSSPPSTPPAQPTLRNVLVLGGSYGGMHCASVLAEQLPPGYRVILIERNSHFNHLYCFPRFSVLSGHEHEAFIPYTSIYASELPPENPLPKPVTESLKQFPPSKELPAEDAATSVQKSLLFDDGPTSGGAETFDAPRASNSPPYSPKSDASSDVGTFATPSHNSSGQTSVIGEDDAQSTKADLSVDQTVGEGDMEKMIEQDAQNVAAQSSSPFKVANLAEDKTDEVGPVVEEDLTAQSQGASHGAPTETKKNEEETHPHLVLQAAVTKISPAHVTVSLSRSAPTDAVLSKLGHAPAKKLWSIDEVSIPYDYLVYALGSKMPDPLRSDARSKTQGMCWMKDMQSRIQTSKQILIVGGGALGVEYALDIATAYPDKAKNVTLLHSRKQLLPHFDPAVHDLVIERLEKAGVNVILGERLALAQGCPFNSTVSPATEKDRRIGFNGVAASPLDQPEGETQYIRTTTGRELEADLLLLCTGQQPNSALMASFSPSSVDPTTRLVKVAPSLQVQVDPAKADAPEPFTFRAPCGQCDCFVERKTGEEHPHLDPQSKSELEVSPVIPNVYAIGDVADAFGAINAGYQAWAMADVAARSIVRQIRTKEDASLGVSSGSDVEHFTPQPAMLKLSLGLGSMLFQGLPGEDGKPLVEVRDDPEDLGVKTIWRFMAKASTEDMYR